MTTLQHKIDFAIVIKVTNANPNGDPLNGNRPRTTYDGIGEITDVCLKRKLRDRLQEANQESPKPDGAIFVQSDDRRIDEFRSLAERAKETLKDALGGPQTAELACKTWFDAARRLTRPRLARLVDAVRETLTEAIAKGGSTLRDYVDSRGEPGYFQLEYYVYGREGLPCRVCGSPLRSLRLGGRATTWCPSCQR